MGNEVFWPPAKDLAALFGVHISTARRWRRERYAPPAIIMILSGDLGVFHHDWCGWRVAGGLLISPEQLQLSVATARSVPFMQMQIAALQHDVAAMRTMRDTGLENQPEPVEWDLTRVLAG